MHLSESDIEIMACADFVPDATSVRRVVRAELRLGELVPKPRAPHRVEKPVEYKV